MAKYIVCIILLYIIVAQISARNSYRFCKKDKECRNITCRKARECKCNSLYQPIVGER